MVKRLAVVGAAVAVVFALAGCEPSMTITARDADHSTTCGYVMHVVGNVTPANATAKVVLQQTAGGKWVDVKGWADSDVIFSTPPSLRTANVSKTSGGYSIAEYVDWMGTKHLRVRSSGGGGTSPGFYVTITGFDAPCS